MYIDLDNVKLGVRIFFRLIEKGEINRFDDRELMDIIDNDEIKHVLNELQEETGTIILYGQERIYITAKTDNKVFGYKNADLRSILHIDSNDELYTCYFIMLSIIAIFYRGEGYDIKSRDFLKIEELHDFIDEKIKTFKSMENINSIEESLDFNFATVVSKWNDMIVYDERKKNLNRSENNRMGYIGKVIRFLTGEGLLFAEDDRIIRTTEKMDKMVTVYYTGKDRKKEILDFINHAV